MEPLSFRDIVDIDKLQRMMDAFHEATRIPVGILDAKGTALVVTGWQEICSIFHRANPVTHELCRQSDGYISAKLPRGGYIEYRCKNGLYELATPIIIDGQHVASLFLGQFFYDDEPPDEIAFIEQAQRYGFDVTEYLNALRKAPIYSRDQVQRIMAYYEVFVQFLVDVGMARLCQRQAEQELQKSEGRLRAIFDNAGIGVGVISRDGRWVQVNPLWASMLGYTADELCSMMYTDVIVPEEVEDTQQRLQLFLRGKYPHFNMEKRFRRKDGTLFWADLSVTPIYSPEDTVEAIIGVGSDITKAKRAQQSLQESEERYRRMTEAVTDYFFTVRVENGVPVETNHSPACIAVTGFSSEEFRENPLLWYQMVHEEDRPAVLQQVQDILTGGPAQAIEHRIIHKDGSTRWVRNTPVPHRDPQVGLLSYDGVLQDITERKIAEQEREKLEQQIHYAQKMESLGVLAGGIAHDFNNLLMGVLGNAELALMDLAEDSPVLESVANIKKAAQRAAELSRQMLAYSGKGKSVTELIDLNELIQEMYHLLQTIISKQVLMRFQFADTLSLIEGDPTQIRQVVMNLIINAAESMENKAGDITIATGVLECSRQRLAEMYLDEHLPEGTYVYIKISDTGCGMCEDTLKRIFDPFFTTKFTGRGLGLAAVLGIIRGHDGAIHVDSEPGRGTTMQILFPASSDTLMDSPEQPESAETVFRKGSILVVDDDENTRYVSMKMLKKMGLRVYVAENGLEAIDLYKRHARSILCALLDLTMPGADGVETSRMLREIKPDLPILLMSGYHEQELARRFEGKGFDGFIQKPFQYSYLLSKIAVVLLRQ